MLFEALRFYLIEFAIGFVIFIWLVLSDDKFYDVDDRDKGDKIGEKDDEIN